MRHRMQGNEGRWNGFTNEEFEVLCAALWQEDDRPHRGLNFEALERLLAELPRERSLRGLPE